MPTCSVAHSFVLLTASFLALYLGTGCSVVLAVLFRFRSWQDLVWRDFAPLLLSVLVWPVLGVWL